MNGNKFLLDINIILYILAGDRTITATAISLTLTYITADKPFKQINNLLLELYEY